MITTQEFWDGLEVIEVPLIEIFREVLQEVKPKNVLEIGSGWGLFSRSVMEFSDAKLVTVDKIPPHLLKDYNKRCDGFESRIRRICADSKEVVPMLGSFDLIYIDGDHTYDGFKGDLEICWGKAKVMLVDDIFHKHNYDTQYGISRALWEKLREKQACLIIYPVAHGVGRLDI